MQLTGAEILLECLIAEGVDVMFGYPGGAILPTYDAMAKYPQLRHVLVRHEQGASHMADGYSRASGKVGVCIATSGPGATNLVTGLATAMMDSVGIVAITGQVGRASIGTDACSPTAWTPKQSWPIPSPLRTRSGPLASSARRSTSAPPRSNRNCWLG